MKRLLAVALAVFVIVAPPIAVAQEQNALYLAQILSDRQQIVSALGPCHAPLECVQAPGVGYP